MNELQRYILKKIKSGEWVNGYKIPNEKMLMEKFNFSKQTVRKVISHLNDLNILYSIQGKGVYVSKFCDLLLLENSINKRTKGETIKLPTKHKIPNKILERKNLEIEKLNSIQQFIEIFFHEDDVVKYSIFWIFSKENIGKNYSITIDNIDVTLTERKVSELNELDMKIFNISKDVEKFLIITNEFFFDSKNSVKVIKITKTLPKNFEDFSLTKNIR